MLLIIICDKISVFFKNIIDNILQNNYIVITQKNKTNDISKA